MSVIVGSGFLGQNSPSNVVCYLYTSFCNVVCYLYTIILSRFLMNLREKISSKLIQINCVQFSYVCTMIAVSTVGLQCRCNNLIKWWLQHDCNNSFLILYLLFHKCDFWLQKCLSHKHQQNYYYYNYYYYYRYCNYLISLIHIVWIVELEYCIAWLTGILAYFIEVWPFTRERCVSCLYTVTVYGMSISLWHTLCVWWKYYWA